MKRIALIGNSPVMSFLVERLCAQENGFALTLFPGEKDLPYFRHRLPALAGKKISASGSAVRPESFYQERKVQICEEKITRLNPKRKRITTEDKQSFEFDAMVFSSTETVDFGETKGTNKTGIYYSRRQADVNEFAKNFGMADTLFIQSDDLSGLKLIAALLDAKRELALVCESPRIFSKILDEESSARVRTFLEEAGVRIFEQTSIAELLGESDVRAVRLTSGKVIAAQMAFFTKGKADLRILRETDVQMTEAGIPVDAAFQTNVEGFFAVDAAVSSSSLHIQDYDSYPHDLEQQARAVAGRLLGISDEPSAKLVAEASVRLGERELAWLGRTDVAEQAVTRRHSNGGLARLLGQQGRISGAFLVNVSEQRETIEQALLRADEFSTCGQALFPASEGWEDLSPGRPEEHFSASGAGNAPAESSGIESEIPADQPVKS